MATNPLGYINAGFERLDYYVLDTNGYVIGTATSLANGADSGGGQLIGVNTADVSVPEARTVVVQGDDRVLGQFTFSSDALPTFTIESAVFDQVLTSLAQGTKRHAIGDSTFIGYQPKDPNYISMCIVATSKGLTQDTSTINQKGFTTFTFPNVTIVPLGTPGLNNAQAQTNRYRVTVNNANKYPFGLAFSDTNNGTTEFSYLETNTENRTAMHTFIGDGSTDSFTLDQTVASDTDGDKTKIYVNGVVQTISTDFTMSTTAGVTTVTWEAGSIPSAGEVCVVYYEYTL